MIRIHWSGNSYDDKTGILETRFIICELNRTGRDNVVTDLTGRIDPALIQSYFLAVQVNLTGEDGGVFYVEVKDGKISAEPYEYNDRNCALTMNTNDFHKMLDGKLDPIVAFTLGKLKVDGDIGKALEFAKIVK